MSGDPVGGSILCLSGMILLCCLASLSESACSSLNENKIHHDAEDGDDRAEKLKQIVDHPFLRYPFVRILLLLCTQTVAAIAALQIAPALGLTMTATGLSAADAEVLSAILLILLFTVIVMVLGDRVPRYIGIRYAEDVAFNAFKLLRFLHILFFPVRKVTEFLSACLLKLFRINPEELDDEVTEEEIRALVDAGGEAGAIEETEKEMIENIFEFNNTSAEDVMTHRTDVTAIWIDDDQETILKTIRESGLSRFPVYQEDMDDIIGVLSTRSFLLNLTNPQPKPLKSIVRKAYFVPETVQADVLFREMQKKKMHMAIVVDEYGGMSGIVTMEDLLEEIVGNIYDETDPLAVADFQKIGPDTWRIAGNTTLDDIAEELDIDFEDADEIDTLGGLVFSRLTTIPQDGSKPAVDIGPLHIQVEKLNDHRVESAIVTVNREDDGEAAEQEN